MLSRLVCLLLLWPTLALSYELEARGLDGTSEPFIAHQGPGQWDSYLALNLPFASAAELRAAIEEREGVVLKHRGEAHVTVVTPIEYWQYLRPVGITMEDIHLLARQARLQSARLSAVCLGQGQAPLADRLESTYFVVVKSPELVKLREELEDLYLLRGGDPLGFRASWFFPHITIGFTKDDLHESNGVIKDERSCVSSLTIR